MAELVVSKKNIASLLSLSDKGVAVANKKFIIPEYQRPYSWDTELCDTLWTDIVNFYTSLKEDENAAPEYFLGTIVTCSDRENSDNIDIIDGQQRITSLLLLMRAFYKQLEDMRKESPNDPNVLGLITTINPCIWQIEPKNRISKVVTDFTKLKIESRAALDKDNADFKTILSTGSITDTKSNYSKNYKYFLNKCMDYAKHNPMDWKELCQTILENCIVLPIECNDISSALTIFGTLNNRGMPLTDSDIFKAELYKFKKTPEGKNKFANDWKTLEETADDGGFTINDVFRYYTHVIRAQKGITEKEIGLRRFYAGQNQKFEIFKKNGFFEDIMNLAEFWNRMNLNAKIFNKDNGYCTVEATKYMQCLIAYPNDYWRCLVTVFYFKNRGKENFKEKFESFLRRLLAYLDVLFIMKPMVNEVKVPIFKFCVEVEKMGDAIFKYDIPDDFAHRIDNASQGISRIVKPLILLNSYLYDPKQPLIQNAKVEIEHILPKKWGTANYNGWDRSEADLMLESIGNKIPFEKKLNIHAGNGYFGKKKETYKSSVINEVRSLCAHSSDDWLKEDIAKRRDEVCNRLIAFFKDNLNPVIIPDSQEEILNVKKGKESVAITKLTISGAVSYRLNQTRQVDANKLSMTQVLSGEIPTTQNSKDFDDLKSAIQAIDKAILMGADSIEATDEVKQALYENY